MYKYITKAKGATWRAELLSGSFVNIYVNSGWFLDVWMTERQMLEIGLSFLFTTCIESCFIFKGISTSDLFFRLFLNLLQHM